MDEMFSRSGNRILSIGSHYLCSRFDPVKEARQWVRAQKEKKDSLPLNSHYGAVILGAGAGYHLVEFRRQFPRAPLVVFESSIKSKIFIDQQFPIELFEVPIFLPTEEEKIWLDPTFQKIMQGRFSVFIHEPSRMLNPRWFDQCLSDVLGRSQRGLQFQLGIRDDFALLENIKESVYEGEYANWKLFDAFTDQDWNQLPAHAFFLTRTLRELIV